MAFFDQFVFGFYQDIHITQLQLVAGQPFERFFGELEETRITHEQVGAFADAFDEFFVFQSDAVRQFFLEFAGDFFEIAVEAVILLAHFTELGAGEGSEEGEGVDVSAATDVQING